MERNKKCKRLLNDMKSVEWKNISLFKRTNYASKIRKIPQTAIKSAMFFSVICILSLFHNKHWAFAFPLKIINSWISANYHQNQPFVFLLKREVAEDGAGNGFRDFVHVWDNGIFYGVNMNRYTDMGSYSPAFEKNVCNCLICSIIYNLAGLEELS